MWPFDESHILSVCQWLCSHIIRPDVELECRIGHMMTWGYDGSGRKTPTPFAVPGIIEIASLKYH